jgi:integrase
LRFDRIGPRWLRLLTKRWARWRLSTGVSTSSVAGGVVIVIEFAASFPELDDGPATVTRDLIERHLARLAVAYPNAKGRTSRISQLAMLLRTTRQHGWEPRLPATADIYREDYPRQIEPAPRAISEAVMAQLEDPANLELFEDGQARVLAEILMRTGLRVGDGIRLAVGCVVHDPHGAPYLAYRNNKMRRDAMVPIDVALAATIAAQQHEVPATFPTAEHLLVREKRNPLGQLHYSADTFRHRLAAWLAACDVRDELGRPVHVTPHQWRHTYATRLINSDVSQEVVRRLLDHTTHIMTARYARLSQQTIRAKWEAARKVDVRGIDVTPPDGDLADAQWMRTNLERAKMALPNGYCTLPIQQNCEYANACLTCSMFVTTAEFLPAHREQLVRTRKLIARGESDGQLRLVEMNRSVETNLTAIITALETDARRHDDSDPVLDAS